MSDNFPGQFQTFLYFFKAIISFPFIGKWELIQKGCLVIILQRWATFLQYQVIMWLGSIRVLLQCYFFLWLNLLKLRIQLNPCRILRLILIYCDVTQLFILVLCARHESETSTSNRIYAICLSPGLSIGATFVEVWLTDNVQFLFKRTRITPTHIHIHFLQILCFYC